MKDEDINKILQKLKIPEPDETTKNATIKSVMDEFHQQKLSYQKNLKGIEGERRLTSKLRTILTFIGVFDMKKQFAIAGGITVFVGVMVYGSFYYMLLPKRSLRNMIVSETADRPAGLKTANEELDTAGKTLIDDWAVREDNGKIDTTNQYALSAEQKQVEISGESEGVSSMLAFKDAALKVPSGKTKSMTRQMMKKGRASEIVGGIKDLNAFMPEPGEYRTYEYQETGRDKFETITTNPIKQVSVEPVSTFSIDVDTAAYAFVRRQLNNGVLPQNNAVRIEEMINYFDYDYSVPTDKTIPFKPTIAVYPSPWNPETKLLHIGIKGYDIVPEKKPGSNLVFLIDVSGSMDAHDKLSLLKNSFRMLVNSLGEEDTISIVVYAGAAGTVLEPTKVKEKGKILAALDQLQAGGSTAGGEGIRRAYELAETNFNKDGLNRVILATDGDFNVGITNSEELKSFIERKRKTGIFLSVLGFGQGNYNDALMQKLAQNGNGNAAYIDNLNEARKVLVEEAGSTLFTIAKDVKIQIEFNPNLVAEYRLIGYESRMLKREDFNNDKVDAGDIGSGHSVTAIYEITLVGTKSKFIDDLRYDNKNEEKATSKSFDHEYAFLKIRYKLPGSDKSQLIDTPIMPENEYTESEQVSTDIRFAASVAAFGQLLRGGTYTGEYTYEDIIKLGEASTGKDKFGYRHEFINLVRLAASL